MSTLGLLSALMKREFRRLASRRIYWFILILAPAFCFIFFADLLKQGLPMKLPILPEWKTVPASHSPWMPIPMMYLKVM